MFTIPVGSRTTTVTAFVATIRFNQDLAFYLSLSALLGENIYNFGELLAHPIVHVINDKLGVGSSNVGVASQLRL